MQKRATGLKHIALLLLSTSLPLAPVFADPVAGKMPGPYAEKIAGLKYEKIEPLFPLSQTSMSCLLTKDNPLLIGLAHQIVIDSPLDQVVKVFEDFDHYPEIFTSLKKSKLIEKKDAKTFLVEFEGIVPFPFVPNSTYQVEYDTHAETLTDRKIYTFQLSKSDDLKSLDGYVMIKKISDTQTLYDEVDFLDAKWGIAKTFAPKSIWSDSVEDILQTDYALKFRAEDSKAESKEIRKKSEKSLDAISKDIEKCIQEKKAAETFL